MTTFWNTFNQLCEKAGKSCNAVAIDLNLSNATTTQWRHGSIPRSKTLNRIADYFNVSVEYLMSGVETPTAQLESNQNDADLVDAISDLSSSDRDTVLALIKIMKEKNNPQPKSGV